MKFVKKFGKKFTGTFTRTFTRTFSWPKWPRLKFKPSRPRLPAWRAFRRPRLKLALPRARFKLAHLMIGGGLLGMIVLGALGRRVVWPKLRPPAPVAAQATPDAPKTDAPKTDAPKTDASKTDAPKTDASARASRMSLATSPAPPKSEGKTAPAPTAVTRKAPRDKEADRARAVAALSAPPPPPSEAERLVRQLQDAQNRVAEGDAEAYHDMPRLVAAIGARFAELPPETWADERNARALVLYLLSGGNSVVGRRLLGENTLAPAEAPLAKGAVAYLAGIDCAERDALLDIDPRRLDAALGAQVAFVQAILLVKYDRAKAIGKLDIARLLAPGGLVEEAALRREASLVSETARFDKFAELARQYWSRFRRSPYADNFLRQFLVDAERVSALITVEQWTRLDEFMDSLTVGRRRVFYLAMAQTAAVAGNSAFADFAARRALALAAPDSVERQRALLYRAAANVARVGAPPYGELLSGLDRARLPRADRPLYDAVIVIAARITREPERNFAAAPPGAGDLAGGEFARAEASLRAADAAIDAGRKSMERWSQ
jgi:chemotaxis protein MotC